MKNPTRNSRICFAARVAAMALALCLIICTVVPGLTAEAASYGLWVGGVQVTSSNAGSLLSGKASYDAATSTLTLNGASITNGIGVYDSDAHAAIYAEGDLNIVLKGTNAIRVNGYAAAVDGKLTISGSGSLTATTTGDEFSGLFTIKGFSMSGGIVRLTASGNACAGLWSCSDVTISGGELTASATGTNANGILCEGDLTVNTGKVTALSSGQEGWGAVVSGDVSVGSGSLSITASGKYTTGLYASTLEISGGDFTASGAEYAVDLAGASSITIGSRYTLSEGSAAPGSTVSSFSNSSSVSGAFLSKPYIKAVSNLDIIRLGGTSRVDTSVVISEYGWDHADNVVLATAYNFADALSGVPLAYALNAPILLINGKTVDDSVMRQIDALGAKNVYLLGGESAISKASFDQLEDEGLRVERVYGGSRYATSVAIAKKLAEITGKSPKTIYFTYGYSFPDALAISSAAALTGSPILYVPKTGSLDSSVSEYIDGLSFSAVVLGGEVAVDAGVYDTISGYASGIKRLSGTSRYDTAVAILNEHSSVYTSKGIAIATGTNYPDALAGAALAAKNGMAVLLVPASLKEGTDQTTSLRSFITNTTSPICVFGGTIAVSDEVIGILLG